MLKHFKRLMHPVRVEHPNVQYAVLLQEQLGGANGELKAAMQYMAQSFYVKEQELKDMLMEIAAEEFNHMEMISVTIQMLKGENVSVKPSDFWVQSPFCFVNMDGVPFCAEKRRKTRAQRGMRNALQADQPRDQKQAESCAAADLSRHFQRVRAFCLPEGGGHASCGGASF